MIKYLSKDLKTFDEFIEKLDKLKECLKNASSSKSNISISTIHSAKGLEYDNVFIIDLIDGEFSFELYEGANKLFWRKIIRRREKIILCCND